MGLKTYSLRLDEEVYESLKKQLDDYGDPDLNISFILRKVLRDFNEALPHLKKSDFSLMNNLALWGTALKQLYTLSQLENIAKGHPITDRAQAEVDDKKLWGKNKKK